MHVIRNTQEQMTLSAVTCEPTRKVFEIVVGLRGLMVEMQTAAPKLEDFRGAQSQ